MPQRRKGLVFDVGMHVGDDTAYYLKRGYTVVALEANPDLVRSAEQRFAEALVHGRLTIVQAAVVANERADVVFYVSRKSAKSSLARESAEDGGYARSVRVPALTLAALFAEFGVPLYCKIDIESADLDALTSLASVVELPRYLSVETGGLPGEPVYGGQAALATLAQLEVLGYRGFKLVNQATLAVMPVDRPVYSRTESVVDRIASRLGRPRDTWRRRLLYHRMRHHFSLNSSGPFGDNLPGEWVDAATARRMVLFHADDVQRAALPQSVFWCDWHAIR
jgi:FkbM family methyltransferase